MVTITTTIKLSPDELRAIVAEKYQVSADAVTFEVENHPQKFGHDKAGPIYVDMPQFQGVTIKQATVEAHG